MHITPRNPNGGRDVPQGCSRCRRSPHALSGKPRPRAAARQRLLRLPACPLRPHPTLAQALTCWPSVAASPPRTGAQPASPWAQDMAGVTGEGAHAGPFTSPARHAQMSRGSCSPSQQILDQSCRTVLASTELASTPAWHACMTAEPAGDARAGQRCASTADPHRPCKSSVNSTLSSRGCAPSRR